MDYTTDGNDKGGSKRKFEPLGWWERETEDGTPITDADFEEITDETEQETAHDRLAREYEARYGNDQESKIGYTVGHGLLSFAGWIISGIGWVLAQIGQGIALAAKWIWDNILFPMFQAAVDWLTGKHAESREVTIRGWHYVAAIVMIWGGFTYYVGNTPGYYGGKLVAASGVSIPNVSDLNPWGTPVVLAGLEDGDVTESTQVALDTDHPYPSLYWMEPSEARAFVNSALGEKTKCFARTLFSEDPIPQGKVHLGWIFRNRVEFEDQFPEATRSFGDGYCGVALHRNQMSGNQPSASRFDLNMSGEYDEVMPNRINQADWVESIIIAKAIIEAPAALNPTFPDELYWYHPVGMKNGGTPSWAEGCKATHVMRDPENPVGGKIYLASYRASTCRGLKSWLEGQGLDLAQVPQDRVSSTFEQTAP